LLKFLKKCFADQDGGPAGSTIVLLAAVACAGTGEWKYALGIAVVLIGIWASISSDKASSLQPEINAQSRNVLSYGWMTGLSLASVVAYDYRSAFFMSFVALIIPLAAVLITSAIAATKSTKLAG
jgi:hypothetical protein